MMALDERRATPNADTAYLPPCVSTPRKRGCAPPATLDTHARATNQPSQRVAFGTVFTHSARAPINSLPSLPPDTPTNRLSLKRLDRQYHDRLQQQQQRRAVKRARGRASEREAVARRMADAAAGAPPP
jgi:hypothetical protein